MSQNKPKLISLSFKAVPQTFKQYSFFTFATASLFLVATSLIRINKLMNENNKHSCLCHPVTNYPELNFVCCHQISHTYWRPAKNTKCSWCSRLTGSQNNTHCKNDYKISTHSPVLKLYPNECQGSVTPTE